MPERKKPERKKPERKKPERKQPERKQPEKKQPERNRPEQEPTGAPFDHLAAARKVGPILTEQRDAAERQGYLSEAAVTALGQSGLLRSWRPATLGGLELTPLAYAEAAEEVARIDSAAAWLMMVVANTTFDLRLASEALIEEIFAADDVIVCETFNRPLSARPVGGGYRVSGTAPFASGCRHAHWLGHTAVVDDELLLMFHPAGALTIEDDWQPLGLRGTASNSITADDVLVPRHRCIHLGSAQPNRYYESPFYRMPEAILTATFPPVSLGLLAQALQAATETARTRQPFASASSLRHRPLSQQHFGQALATYRAARDYFHATLIRAQRRAGEAPERGSFTLTDKADLFLACAHTLQSAAQATRNLARAVGTSAIHQGHPIERAWRDTEVIAQHAFGAEGRFATVAQAYWALDVDFPLLAMD